MNILIRNNSQIPIYKQITDQLKNAIINGELKPGDSLPSIRKLAKELRVSIITTKRAFSELEKENFVYTVTGKGTFVAEQNLEFVKEEKQKTIELHLLKSIKVARSIKLTLEDMKEALELLWEEE
jgi:GntR family transcriptional regulator